MSAVRATLRTAAALKQNGLIPGDRTDGIERVAKRYALAITPAIADLIDPSNPDDPIARQFIPDERELQATPQERADPIGDNAHSPVEGIVHRYPDRVLLKLVHVCAIYCRFCFRREMVGPQQSHALSAAALERSLDYIRDHPEIWEVILTGGDPLVLSPRRLKDVVRRLAAIDHVKIHRLHTRVPVADPERVTSALVRALKATEKATYVVVHVNHPRELSPAAVGACARLIDAGIPVLSQSVLLKGVNDDADTLVALCRALVEARIKPYYLHHADLAPGTAHFRNQIEHGQALMRELKARVSGLCQPDYVLDIPGGHAKARLNANDIAETDDGWRLRDAHGAWHAYP